MARRICKIDAEIVVLGSGFAGSLMALVLQEGGVGRSDWFEWIRAVPAFERLEAEQVSEVLADMLQNIHHHLQYFHHHTALLD